MDGTRWCQQGRSGRPGAVDAAPDVVVWEADGTVDGRRGYGRALADRLVAQGWRVETVPLPERAPDERQASAPVHVISGGNTSVDDDAAWLAEARRRLGPVLDRALVGSASVTGICFGSQLIASQLAGRGAVGPHPGGMQAGLSNAVDASGASHVVSSYHYHRIDPVALERAGGRVTLASGTTPVEAYEFGAGVRGVQFHPEWAPSALMRTLRSNRAVVEGHGATLAASVASVRRHGRRWSGTMWDRVVTEPARSVLAGTPLAAAA